MSATNSSTSCIVLDASTPCGPEYAGYPIVSLASQRQNDLTFFTNQARAMTSLDDLVNGPISFSNTGCNTAQAATAISMVRYATSLWCARAVTTAISRGCSVPNQNGLLPRGPFLCETECNAAAASLDSVFSNSTLCPAATEIATALRSSVVEGIRNFCSLSKTNQGSNNGQCSKGVASDQKTCGFASDRMASQNCRSVSNDPCCASLTGSSGSPSGSSSTSGTTTNPTSSNNTTNTRNTAERPSVKKSVALGLVGLLALSAISM